MAFENETEQDPKKVAGYMNISVVDKNGEMHRVGRRGVSLFRTNRVDNSILKKAENLQEGESLELDIRVQVHVSGTEPQEDLDL